jgi:hypothetical protein
MKLLNNVLNYMTWALTVIYFPTVIMTGMAICIIYIRIQLYRLNSLNTGFFYKFNDVVSKENHGKTIMGMIFTTFAVFFSQYYYISIPALFIIVIELFIEIRDYNRR